ncbi:MAG: hypothetical protein ACFE8L_14905 [Candidatus Hodarchaeota archaeon]
MIFIPKLLFHSDKRKDEIVCKKCKYRLVKPYPKDSLCPKCGTFLADLYDYLSENDQIKTEPKQFETKTKTVTTKVKGARLKEKKTLHIDLESNKIELTKGEYVKLIGITSKDRTPLYYNNKNYEYLLELTNNLDFIATGVLGGVLDKMLLISEENNEQEKCQFYEQNNIIYLVYGKFPDKKGEWVLKHISRDFENLVREKDVDNLSEPEKKFLKKDFRPIMKSILEAYVNLQEVFGDEDLGYVEDTIRVDYLGLSSMSIGVISLLLSDDELNIEVPGDYENPYEELEMKESMLTARIEAIAANTQGNTGAVPRWIAVKLGFQHYRFLTFKKYQNDYFLNMLSDGNLEKIVDVEKMLDAEIKEKTNTPFSGNLQPFNELKSILKEHFSKRKEFPPFNFNKEEINQAQ